MIPIDKSENTSAYKTTVITKELQDIESAKGAEGIIWKYLRSKWTFDSVENLKYKNTKNSKWKRA